MRKVFWFSTLVASLLFSSAVQATVLFQTEANPDHSHCCGSVSIFSGNYSPLGNPQWLGARFSLSAPAHVDGIGADFSYFEGTIFGAIVSLDNAGALPEGNPFTSTNVLAEITIDGGDPIYPVNVDLTSGSYGLVFGSGYFGTQGFSGIWQTDVVDPNGSFFDYSNGGQRPGGPLWQEAGFQGTQFTVTGSLSPVPEPASWAFMLAGIAVTGAMLRSRRAAPAGPWR